MPKQVSEFEYKEKKFKVHLRFSSPHNNKMVIAMHTNCYGNSLPFLTAMSNHLLSLVPFGFVHEYFEVEKLAGPRYENIMSVQTYIDFTGIVDEETATKLLLAAGFQYGLEYTK